MKEHQKAKSESHKHKLRHQLYEKVDLFLIAAVIAFSLISVLELASISSSFGTQNIAKSEENRAANIEIITFSAPDCSDCFDIDSVVSTIKQQKVNVISERKIAFTSNDAKDLKNSYFVNIFPTVIVKGELNKTSQLKSFFLGIGNITGDTFVFTKQTPVYLNSAGIATGRVKLTVIQNEQCSDCASLSNYIFQLKKFGVVLNETRKDYLSADGADLVKKYNITKVPTFVMSKDANAYDVINSIWKDVGTVEADGTFVFRTVVSPYFDILENKTRGIVNVTYLTDSSCAECYNVSAHKAILVQGFGLFISNETLVNVSSDQGIQIVKKYNITKVPTFVMSSEADAYPNLKPVWIDPKNGVGSIESDGSYIFRSVELMGTYKDLKNNTVVKKTTTP